MVTQITQPGGNAVSPFSPVNHIHDGAAGTRHPLPAIFTDFQHCTISHGQQVLPAQPLIKYHLCLHTHSILIVLCLPASDRHF